MEWIATVHYADVRLTDKLEVSLSGDPDRVFCAAGGLISGSRGQLAPSKDLMPWNVVMISQASAGVSA